MVAVPKRLLIFSKTTGYRHASIEAATGALREIVKPDGFDVDSTEDAAAFTDDYVARYDAVVFLSTTGEVFDDAQRATFEQYLRSGGAYVGIHAASNAEPEWPFYGDVVGARFNGHPHIQPATITVTDPHHPATAHLPQGWEWTDEWYNFKAHPQARVLLTVDESSYEGGTMGADHPLAWCHTVHGARSFYTALGHADEYYDEPAFREHLRGCIRWATNSVT